MSPQTSFSSKSASSLRDSRLARYCAAGAGALACAGAVTTADAAIVFVNFGGQVVTDATPGDNYFTTTTFDLNGDGVVDFRLGVANGISSFGGVAAIFARTGGTLGVVGLASGGYNYAGKLTAGAPIGPTAAFVTLTTGNAALASGSGFPNSKWLNTTQGYLGIRFTIGAQTVYGWIRLSVADNNTPGAERNITLLDAAFQTDGTAIAAGQTAVPEPSVTCLGLVALGAIGLVAHRRRTAKAA